MSKISLTLFLNEKTIKKKATPSISGITRKTESFVFVFKRTTEYFSVLLF